MRHKSFFINHNLQNGSYLYKKLVFVLPESSSSDPETAKLFFYLLRNVAHSNLIWPSP